MESLAVQPFADVTVAVYVIEFVGVDVVVNVFVLVKKFDGDQEIDPVPVATKSTDSPRQIVVSLLKLTFGAETLMITWTVSDPHESEIITLKAVVALIVAIGLAIVGLFNRFAGLQL